MSAPRKRSKKPTPTAERKAEVVDAEVVPADSDEAAGEDAGEDAEVAEPGEGELTGELEDVANDDALPVVGSEVIDAEPAEPAAGARESGDEERERGGGR